jgi:uncharacterized damage-inducible protein DinB
MIEMLRALFRHEAWADAEHWRALQAHHAALEDTRILERLYHIHQCQRAYLNLVQGLTLDPQDFPESPPPAADLLASVRQYHREMGRLLRGLTPDRLETLANVPWVGKSQPTTAEALLQVVMHSQYHRGQNASRLRELGGEPPLTDFIAWVGEGHPEPRWP